MRFSQSEGEGQERRISKKGIDGMGITKLCFLWTLTLDDCMFYLF